jgi:NAD(P)-dependent dehydrogenase (short-subunit alcohol dehydrogenase family)
MGHPLFDLSGKSAVVVGGTSGIGLAMAVGLAEAGADVVASSRRPEQVDEAAKAIEATGRRALRLTSDVADATGVAGWNGEGVWQGRYPDQLRGQD